MAGEGRPIRTVLHVLPHPGGGGETYVDVLSRMDGFRFERVYLAPGSKPAEALRSLPRSALDVLRKAGSHDLIHVHGEVAATICLPSIAVRRSVVTLHGLHLVRRTAGAKRLLAASNLRLVVRAATRTICVSNAERADALQFAGNRTQDRLVVIRNGVDPAPTLHPDERVAVRAELSIAPSELVGIYVGSLDEHKDPLVPARAVTEVARSGASLVLLIAGDGPLRAEVERLADESGGRAVRVLGHRRDTQRLLAAADFFVLPSHREGLSFSLLDAMSHGLVPVVSDAPGNSEAVGEAGLVVRRGDVNGFVDAFRDLLADDDRRALLGGRARTRVEVHFRADEMVRRTRELYDQVAESRTFRMGDRPGR
jgi:glycosyltransferase involved in cell wall biosynthesis